MRGRARFFIRFGLTVAGSVACAGCASYLSTPADNKSVDGISYFMPRQAIAVQVAVDAKGVQTASVVPVSPIPDLRRHFVLTYETNMLGENATSIGVSSQGLLESSGSTATSGVDATLKNLAGVAGTASAMAAMAPPPPPPGALPPPPPPPPQQPPSCAAGQTYTMLIWPENVGDEEPVGPLCNFMVRIRKSLLGNGPVPDSAEAAPNQSGSSGIFYKTQLPYLVEFTDAAGGQPNYAIAFSPDEAPISFLPVERTFFAKNTATITLKDGVLNQFAQDDTGEIVAASQIPADVISAYFAAVGAAFSSFSSNNSAANAASLSEAKRQACTAALAANPITPGMSAAAVSSATANIQAACS